MPRDGWEDLMRVFAIPTAQSTMGSIRPSGPSWAAMRPAVQELVTFRHSPQAIAADWRRLRKGHPLTQDQFMQVLRWVYHEKEVRDQRVVARLTKNPALARAHPPAGK